MAALGFLSLADHDEKYRLDSLQQYAEIVPGLQTFLSSEHDLASDGAFLTHYLMLIYELTTADVQHRDMWSYHMDTLLRMTLLRRSIHGAEKFFCVLWRTYRIDLDALLSGMGEGRFVGCMSRNSSSPLFSHHLLPFGLDGSSVVPPEKQDALLVTLQLDCEVTVLAARLGLLANEFRTDSTFDSLDPHSKAVAARMRQSQNLELQEGLRQLWSVPAVRGLAHLQLSVRGRRLLQRSRAIYCACIIYSHTSMWFGQHMDMTPDSHTEVAVAVAQILTTAHAAIASDKFNSQFLVFPLFMAGFASIDSYHITQVTQLLQALEQGAIGRHAFTLRKALTTIHDRRHEQRMHRGHSSDLDWVQTLREQASTVVNFAL